MGAQCEGGYCCCDQLDISSVSVVIEVRFFGVLFVAEEKRGSVVVLEEIGLGLFGLGTAELHGGYLSGGR